MITRILSTAIALTALGAALGFASLEARGKRVTEVDIHVVDNDGAFLTADRIQDSLSAERFIGELLTDLRLQDIVNDLEDMGPCEHAEVYPTMDGVVHIDVWQRKPLVRVHPAEGRDYYLDEQGHRMDLDPHHTPRVPVLHASTEIQSRLGHEFVMATHEDPFWNALTDQLFFNEEGEFSMEPRLHGHDIVLGSVDQLEVKKRNLLAFYRAQAKQGNLRNYKRIDLTYRNQVIAQRK